MSQTNVPTRTNRKATVLLWLLASFVLLAASFCSGRYVQAARDSRVHAGSQEESSQAAKEATAALQTDEMWRNLCKEDKAYCEPKKIATVHPGETLRIDMSTPGTVRTKRTLMQFGITVYLGHKQSFLFSCGDNDEFGLPLSSANFNQGMVSCP